MHFMFNTNNYGLHGATLGNVWLPWVTRGIFIGQRRMILSTQVCGETVSSAYTALKAKGRGSKGQAARKSNLSPLLILGARTHGQIDDVYLDTGTYNTKYNRQALDDESNYPYTYRSTASDWEVLRQYQKNLRTSVLPAGSNFTIEVAHNARGYYEFRNITQPGVNANGYFEKYRDEYLWVTHTWNHIDMYVFAMTHDDSRRDSNKQ